MPKESKPSLINYLEPDINVKEIRTGEPKMHVKCYAVNPIQSVRNSLDQETPVLLPTVQKINECQKNP